jgi:hypothetical protein
MAHLDAALPSAGPLSVALLCVEEDAGWARVPARDVPRGCALAAHAREGVWVDTAAAAWTARLAPRPLGGGGLLPRASAALGRPGEAAFMGVHLLHGEQVLDEVVRGMHALDVLAAARGRPAPIASLRVLEHALVGALP